MRRSPISMMSPLKRRDDSTGLRLTYVPVMLPLSVIV